MPGSSCTCRYRALRPRVIADFYPSAGVSAIAAEVDDIVLSIVDEARR
jgi:hypothetical protein